MNSYFDLRDDQKKMVITQTANKIGLPVQAIEKDLWVSTILKVVFTLPFADKLVFKGGTSLSKVYHLIDRMSEDIDLAIDRSFFGLTGDLTKRQTKKLRKQSSLFVRDEFASQLEGRLKEYGLEQYLTVEPEPDGEGDNTYSEPRKIHIRYNALFGKPSYLNPEVMLEIGSRSLFEPTEIARVSSLVTSSFPQVNTDVVDTDIRTAKAEKTFLEKAFLLHEMFTTERAHVADRKSRHLYDLEKMMDEQFAINGINDDELWNTIAHHREVFTSIHGVDYTPDIRKRIKLTPPKEYLDVWKKDYEAMQLSMIYGDSLPFDKLLERMVELEGRFHSI